jgi:glycosyltransferase involved in cell wall biosynthesis
MRTAPLKVALLTEIIAPHRIAPFNELARIPEIDLEVLFFAKSEDRRGWTLPDQSDIRFRFSVLPGFMVGRRYQSTQLFLNPGIIGTLHRGRHDVIVTGGYHHPTIWLALGYCRASGRPILAWSESTARDARGSGAMADRFKRALVRRFDGFIAAGIRQAEYLQMMGASSDRIWIAPDAIDIGFFERAAALRATHGETEKRTLNLSGPVLLYAGRLLDKKGLPDLLEVFDLIRQRFGASLLLVGEGPDRARYEELCRARNLAGVHFAGFVQPGDLLKYYAVADVFVFPTHSDPWGLAINEAMAAGLPCVVSDAAGAVDELVRHGDSGLVYRAGDREALRSSICRLLEDQVLRQQMIAGAARAVRRHTPERMARGMADAVLAVVSQADRCRESAPRA